MPIQAPHWMDYLNCPVCCREFGLPPRSPISLGCGHTLCHHCLKYLHIKQCPFDQTVIQSEPEELVVNTALLQLAGYAPPAQPHHPPCIQVLPEHDKLAYDAIVRDLEHLAVYLKLCGSANSGLSGGSRLSRPMQKKLVTLLLCSMVDEEGRGRAARAARSLGERTVTELILQHQNPQQLSANLWAAVRARGCQFLGPAMQEEVLKLVLLALEDGSALSRKVLVMFVVQRLEPHFPQASKTSIGHVVQLLYRASCFKVSKRECDSSLMQLKDEFRTYGSLRREHDAQIVQIASEAGLRIAPDQWSSLLYGDTLHKSHMQSIIDKLQTPQSFAQSVQDLFIALQRTGDPAQLLLTSIHLDRLANIDGSPEQKSPTLEELAGLINSTKEVVSGLIHYLQKGFGRDSNYHKNSPLEKCEDQTNKTPATTPLQENKMPMCRISAIRAFCPSGDECPFLHFDEEFERIQAKELEEENENAMAALEPFPLAPQRPIANQGLVNGNAFGFAAPAAGAGVRLVNGNQYVFVTQVPAGPGVPIGPAVAQRLVALPAVPGVPAVPAVPGIAVPRVALPVPIPPQHVFPRYPLPPLPRLRVAPVDGYNMQHMPPNGHGAANQHEHGHRDHRHNDGGAPRNFGPLMVAGAVRMAIVNPFFPGGIVPNNMGICYSRAEFLRPRYNVMNNGANMAFPNQQQNIQPQQALAANFYAPPPPPQVQLEPRAYNAYAFDDVPPIQPIQRPVQIEYNVPPPFFFGNEQHDGRNNWGINNIFNEPPAAAAAELRAEEFANRANEMFSDPPPRAPANPRRDDFGNRDNDV